jgi:hypothetical protein
MGRSMRRSSKRGFLSGGKKLVGVAKQVAPERLWRRMIEEMRREREKAGMSF